jgi:hypothetical protein
LGGDLSRKGEFIGPVHGEPGLVFAAHRVITLTNVGDMIAKSRKSRIIAAIKCHRE